MRAEGGNRRNTKLYFGILLETKDLISALISLLQLYQKNQTLLSGSK